MQKRRAYSLALLAVILPVLFLSFFHRHPGYLEEEIHCVQCADHIPHGHLSADNHISDCLVCHFLGLPFLAGRSQSLRSFVREVCLFFEGYAGTVFLRQESVLPTRGPPAPFCFAAL